MENGNRSTIARPLDGKLSRGQVLMLLGLIWLYVLPWALMPLMGVWGAFAPEGFLTSCTFDYITNSDDIRYFVATIFTFSYCIPMFLIIYFYSRIVGHVVNHEKALREQAKKMNVDSLRSNQGKDTTSAEVRIAKVSMPRLFRSRSLFSAKYVGSTSGIICEFSPGCDCASNEEICEKFPLNGTLN